MTSESSNPSQAGPQVSRRSFLGGSVAGVAGGITWNRLLRICLTRDASSQSNLTPDEALKHLMEGNERFASDTIGKSGQSLNILRQRTVEKQEPFACGARVRGFARAGGDCCLTRRSDNCLWRALRGIFRRQRYRQPGVRRGGAGDEGDYGAGASELRRGDGDDAGQGCSGADQLVVPAYSAGGGQAGGNFEKAMKENAKMQADLMANLRRCSRSW